MHLLDNPIRSEALLAKTLDIEHRFYASSAEPLRHRELDGNRRAQGRS